MANTPKEFFTEESDRIMIRYMVEETIEQKREDWKQRTEDTIGHVTERAYLIAHYLRRDNGKLVFIDEMMKKGNQSVWFALSEHLHPTPASDFRFDDLTLRHIPPSWAWVESGRVKQRVRRQLRMRTSSPYGPNKLQHRPRYIPDELIPKVIDSIIY